MYAVIEAGGKQHRVSPGEKIRIDLLSDKKKGDQMVVDRVLMIGADTYKIGKPYVENAVVKATVTDMGKDGEMLRKFGQKGLSEG